METILPFVWIPFWVFLAAWAYEKDERILSLGVLALGLGTVLIRNPFPISDGIVYPLIAFLLLLVGIAVSGGVGLHRYMENRSNETHHDV